MIRRALFALLMVLMACTAQAQTIGLHIGTAHSEAGYNDRNPGVYVQHRGATLGGYCNSESRSPRFSTSPACVWSTYAGYTAQRELVPGLLSAAVTVGAISGYRAGVQPMAVPSVLIADHLRIFYVPKREKAGTSAVSFAIEVAL